MKYIKTKKISTFKALDDFQGLGRENANALEAGKEVELEDPPKHLVKGGYIKKAEIKNAK